MANANFIRGENLSFASDIGDLSAELLRRHKHWIMVTASAAGDWVQLEQQTQAGTWHISGSRWTATTSELSKVIPFVGLATGLRVRRSGAGITAAYHEAYDDRPITLGAPA